MNKGETMREGRKEQRKGEWRSEQDGRGGMGEKRIGLRKGE